MQKGALVAVVLAAMIAFASATTNVCDGTSNPGYNCGSCIPAAASVTCAADAVVGTTGQGRRVLNGVNDNLSFTDAATLSCPNQGSIARTWAGAVCDNAGFSKVQTITVNDNVNPTATLVNPTYTAPSCGVLPTVSNADVTGSDNCGGALTVTANSPAFTCGQAFTRTFTVADVCGNSIQLAQTLTVPCCGIPTCSTTERQFWCVSGVTDQYYSCWLPWEQGFRPCPPGTRCQHPGVHPTLSSHDGSGACEPDGFD